MIPLHRLQKLPPTQSRLKCAKMFKEAENKILLCNSITEKELNYLLGVLDFCISFSNTRTASALKEISKELHQNLSHMETAGPEVAGAKSSHKHGLRRSLNNIQHILLSDLGRFPSEWDFDKSDYSGELDLKKRSVFPGVVIYLEDIRSPFNVGAIFRTAESFGVERILLSPFCADPMHRRALRTAMGCVSIMPWTRLENEPFSNTSLENTVFTAQTPIFALETKGTEAQDFSFPSQGIMIIGSEELGVSPAGLERADASLGRLSIPVFGAKGSLNVSVAFGIAMHAWALKITQQNPGLKSC